MTSSTFKEIFCKGTSTYKFPKLNIILGTQNSLFIIFNTDCELSLLWLDYTCVCGNLHYIAKHGCSSTSEKYQIILFCTMTCYYDLSQLKRDNDDDQAGS